MNREELLKWKDQVIAFDLDMTLSKTTVENWRDLTPNQQVEEFIKIEPDLDMINLFNTLAEHNTCFVYTARNDTLQKVTYKWLNKHGVNYDYFTMGKPGFSVLIDDKVTNVEDLRETSK